MVAGVDLEQRINLADYEAIKDAQGVRAALEKLIADTQCIGEIIVKHHTQPAESYSVSMPKFTFCDTRKHKQTPKIGVADSEEGALSKYFDHLMTLAHNSNGYLRVQTGTRDIPRNFRNVGLTYRAK